MAEETSKLPVFVETCLAMAADQATDAASLEAVVLTREFIARLSFEVERLLADLGRFQADYDLLREHRNREAVELARLRSETRGQRIEGAAFVKGDDISFIRGEGEPFVEYDGPAILVLLPDSPGDET